MFLDAKLKGRASALTARTEQYAATTLGTDALRAVRVPPGTGGPEPYDPESETPPTPRQLWGMVDELGVDRTCAILGSFRDHEPRSPIYGSTMLSGSLVHELYAAGRTAEAKALYNYVVRIPLDLRSFFDFLATISVMTEKPDRAVRFLEMLLDLDPGAEEQERRLRELQTSSAGD